MIEIEEGDLINWRALVRRVARNYDRLASEIPADDEHVRWTWEEEADKLRKLGDWLDSLAGVPMGKAVNGRGRVSL